MMRLLGIYIICTFPFNYISSECSSFDSGDLNNDAELNIVDIISCIDIVLEIDEYNQSADLNLDNSVNIFDIIILIERVLYPFYMDVEIEQIDFDFNELIIKWNKTDNYGFSSYNLYYSNFINNTEQLVVSKANLLDTSIPSAANNLL